MISLFRINDPFRLVLATLILLMFRLPMLIKGVPLTIPELNWMLLGERMAAGYSMYTDIWDNVAPLSAWVYWLLYVLFGKTTWSFHIIAMILVIFQAGLFNRYVIRMGIYHEKTYVPALLYICAINLSFDFMTLSPVLMALTFLLLVLRNIFRLDDKAVDQEIFKTGLYLGIATLFYLPSIFFLVMTLLGFALFKTSSIRYLLIVIYGYVLVLAVYAIFLFYTNGLQEFYQQCILTFITRNIVSYTDLRELLWIFSLPMVLLLITVVRVRTERGFINFQSNSQQIMIIWILVSFPAVLFAPYLAPNQFILFVPALVFFATHYLLMLRRKWLAEAYFLVFAFALLFNSYHLVFGLVPTDDEFYQKLAVKPFELPDMANKKMLVLGNDLSFYRGNRLSTPYLNWEISKNHFSMLNSYPVLIEISNNLMEDLPEVIVDLTPEQRARQVFERIPSLKERYTLQVMNGTAFYMLNQDMAGPALPANLVP